MRRRILGSTLLVLYALVAIVTATNRQEVSPNPFERYMAFITERSTALVAGEWRCVPAGYIGGVCSTADENFRAVYVSMGTDFEVLSYTFTPRHMLLGEIVAVFGRWDTQAMMRRSRRLGRPREYVLTWDIGVSVRITEYSFLTLQSSVSNVYWK